uniref:Uncharacterized protein n=1 Tax=Anguilla anguilla TaxID=7936 RepID=A0A0E9XJE6_ANGAN
MGGISSGPHSGHKLGLSLLLTTVIFLRAVNITDEETVSIDIDTLYNSPGVP